MTTLSNLFVVGSIIVAGLLAQIIFKKTKIPDAFWLILFGACLSFFGFAQQVKSGGDFTFLITLSLIYVVFYGALPIRLKAMFSTMKYALLSSFLNIVMITGILGSISYFIGFPWTLAFSLGALFCVLDGSIINSLLEILKVGKKAEAQIQVESAIIDTLVIVGVLSLVNFSSMAASDVLRNLISYLLFSFAIGFFAALLWSFALKFVGSHSSSPIATLAVLILIYAFGEFVAANGVITIFSFAIVLGNIPILSSLFYKDQKEHLSVLDMTTKSFFKDLSFLIRAFLFAYLGMLIDVQAWPYLLLGFGFFLIAYLVRSITGRFISNPELSKKDGYLLDAMCAKGLTPVVMLAVLSTSSEFSNIIIGGIFSSVFLTSLLIFFVDRGKFTSLGEIILTAFGIKSVVFSPSSSDENENLK